VVSALVVALGLVGPAHAQDKKDKKKPAAAQPAKPKKSDAPKVAPLAITNARVYTGAGDVIDDATIVIEDGLVREVKKGGAAPAGADVIAGKGLVVTPGLIDGLTSVGLVDVELEPGARDDQEGRQTGDRLRAGFHASDGYNPQSPVIGVTRSEGVTTIGVVPEGGFIAGQSAWADLAGDTADVAIAKSSLALHVNLEPNAGGGDSSRAGAMLRVREAFDDARAWQKNKAGYERNASRRLAPSRLDLEALGDALDKKVPVVFRVDRAADILATLKLSKELGLRPVIAGGAEAWRVTSELVAQKVPVFVNPLINGPNNFDSIGARADNAARLAAAGVNVAISTFDTMNSRKLRQLAGNAVRAGLPHDKAIVAITRAPAEALGMDAKYGTLAAGKVANLVVWSGDPLELSTRPVTVVIRGARVSLRTRQTELLEKYRRVPRP
jgi:imidazolonepropionase-like amidohydrolase